MTAQQLLILITARLELLQRLYQATADEITFLTQLAGALQAQAAAPK